jgi:uncharacterized protein
VFEATTAEPRSTEIGPLPLEGMKAPQWLVDAQYIDLVTYRKNGNPVSTPVWFAIDDADRLVVYADGSSGKIKRIRNSSTVAVAACSMKGKHVGPQMPAVAELLDDAQGPVVHALLNKKYGWKKRLFTLGGSLVEKLKRKPANPEGFIAITLDNES